MGLVLASLLAPFLVPFSDARRSRAAEQPDLGPGSKALCQGWLHPKAPGRSHPVVTLVSHPVLISYLIPTSHTAPICFPAPIRDTVSAVDVSTL